MLHCQFSTKTRFCQLQRISSPEICTSFHSPIAPNTYACTFTYREKLIFFCCVLKLFFLSALPKFLIIEWMHLILSDTIHYSLIDSLNSIYSENVHLIADQLACLGLWYFFFFHFTSTYYKVWALWIFHFHTGIENYWIKNIENGNCYIWNCIFFFILRSVSSIAVARKFPILFRFN